MMDTLPRLRGFFSSNSNMATLLAITIELRSEVRMVKDTESVKRSRPGVFGNVILEHLKAAIADLAGTLRAMRGRSNSVDAGRRAHKYPKMHCDNPKQLELDVN